ncbi:MAG: YlmC/YmxH family sporulation protein [Oscillospiraceae bacterium]|nr:YlmC/YmxH family sporulation protein [Clostridiaceae bacterium]MDY5948066.1 YlmC/YmxH family sporulation protein [Oscillospiraceae bacterium]
MNCCITELRCKEVIDKSNGCRLGLVSDVEVDSCCGRVVALIVLGRPKFWGICGRRERIRVCWEDIDVIGNDTILVCKVQRENRDGRRNRGRN